MNFYNSDPRYVQLFRDVTAERDKSPLNKDIAGGRRCHGCGLSRKQAGGKVVDGKFYCESCKQRLFPDLSPPLHGQEHMDRCLSLLAILEERRSELTSIQKVALTRMRKTASSKYPEGNWRDLIDGAEKIAAALSEQAGFDVAAPH